MALIERAEAVAGKTVAASPRCGVLVAMLVAAPDFWVPCCLFVWAGLLGVPVGGGPPASRPRCELRSARRLEARPGPAATHRHRTQVRVSQLPRLFL